MKRVSIIAIASICFCFFISDLLFGLSIRLLPGGIPIGSPEQLMMEGIRLGNSQMLRRAWEEYEKAVNLHPDQLDGYLKLGRIFFHLSLLGAVGDNDYQKALGYAKRAVEIAPNYFETHQILGMVLSGKGAFLDAMDELKLAFSLNPTNEFVLCDMATLHLALKQPRKTIEMLEGKSLRNGWSYFILALAWLQEGEKGRALINLKKAELRGFNGYWINMAYDAIKRDIKDVLPFANKN